MRIRVPLIYKRIGNYLGGLFFAVCCFFGSFLMFSSGNINVGKSPSVESFVVEKGMTTNKNSIAGRGSMNSDFFYFKIKGLDEKLTVYRASGDYGFLENHINVNDKLKVYYKKHPSDDSKTNLEVYQIEKEDQILYSIDEYQNKERTGAYIAFFGGFLMIGLAIYQDKKYWK